MTLQVVGAGLPRTGTSSLRLALEELLGGPCCHMSAITGHPFDLGDGWKRALAGTGAVDWSRLLDGYVAAVDWPASAFWRELAEANPDALVLVSVRDDTATWWQSFEATILPVARMGMAPDWKEGRDLVTLVERFVGSANWDDPVKLRAAYERHNAAVKRSIARDRLLEWRASDGWAPICRALEVRVPDRPFPWTNRREDWG